MQTDHPTPGWPDRFPKPRILSPPVADV